MSNRLATTTVGVLQVQRSYFSHRKRQNLFRCRADTGVGSRSCSVMEDGAVLIFSEEEDEQELSDQSDVPTESLDQTEEKQLPPQDQEGDPGDEWDTDLETDDATGRRRSLSRAELYLQACQEIGVPPVSSFLRNLSETCLNLTHYGVGPLGAKALAVALGEDRVITHLELEDNTLGPTGTHYLMEMLKLNNSIESLNLSYNQLQPKGAKCVSKMLADNYKVKSIKLSGNEFDDLAIEHIAKALKGDYVVTELDLSNNKFFDAGGESLGQMLACNLGIEDLNLSWNHISMRGAVAVCAALKVNTTLKRLHLSWNGFGCFEAEVLGQALKQNSTLVLLDLTCNRINDQAATLLCHGLAANNTLRVLKLSLNPLTNVGALKLLTTVKNKNSALEEIDISTVFVCEAFVELLEEARQRRPALNVRYSVMCSVTRNISALRVFQKFLKTRNESIMDFFQALDKEGTMKVSTSAFREAVKEANVPLDQGQLEWLVRKFDKSCSATIMYSQLAELS